jgi:hypothetical protein
MLCKQPQVTSDVSYGTAINTWSSILNCWLTGAAQEGVPRFTYILVPLSGTGSADLQMALPVNMWQIGLIGNSHCLYLQDGGKWVLLLVLAPAACLQHAWVGVRCTPMPACTCLR